MPFGICNSSIAPLRLEPDNTSEMTSQILFGEHFSILETSKSWSKIQLHFDGFEGYVLNTQFEEILEEEFQKLSEQNTPFSGDLVNFISNQQNELTTITIGALLPFYKESSFEINGKKFEFEGSIFNQKVSKNDMLSIAFLLLNSPYLWGGRTPFGIDSAGFTQMVYKLGGHHVFRNASEQAKQGEVLSFIEESEPGDLAFFDDENGNINHVGIILKDYNIIHAYGKVRIDILDHSGIYNVDTQNHTHKLRVIKRIIKN